MIELIARKREEMNYTLEEKEAFMREALKEAEIALEYDEIPIGCVIVKDGKVIGRGHNAREELQRAVMHAEIMAIENANLSEESWRLLDCTLFVTIEPCVMCSGGNLVSHGFQTWSTGLKTRNLAPLGACTIF